MHLACPPRIGPEDMEALCVYHWPGNIRELRNIIERLMVLSGDTITSEDVKSYC